jgi:hypothetical protein
MFQPARKRIERSEADHDVAFGPMNRFIAKVAAKPTIA